MAFHRGCSVFDSIGVIYCEEMTSIFPNAFSPNGDGINDVWFFIHPDTAGTLIIFDRWGEVVHKGSNQWDGKKLGEPLPIGVYHYIYYPTDYKNVSGRILIVR